MKKTKLEELKKYADNHFGGIRIVYTSPLVKMMIIENPDFLSLPTDKTHIEIDGLNVGFNEILHNDENSDYKETAVSILKAATSKLAIQTTADALAEYLIRAKEIFVSSTSEDKYDSGDITLKYDIGSLKHTSEISSRMSQEEIDFIFDFVRIMRNSLSHNDGRISPKDPVNYSSTIHGVTFNKNWTSGSYIDLSIPETMAIISIIESIKNKVLLSFIAAS